MGVYVQTTGTPPWPLLKLLDGFEADILGEYLKEHPNIQLMKRKGEEIERIAEELDVDIDWMDTPECPIALLSGACSGAFHMTLAIPIHKRLQSRASNKKVEPRGWP
jgi:hypothetical protein|tara:strand:- start:144 stop:464 length:321 start_codon:yes stop_codon:yes gene_type:complete